MSARAALAGGAVLALLVGCTSGGAHAEPAPGTRASPTPARVEHIYDGTLAPGWLDYGWSHRILGQGPAQIDVSSYGGWIVARPQLEGSFGGLVFELTAPPALGDFLEVRLDDGSAQMFPRVKVGPQHRNDRNRAQGSTEVWISMEELDPQRLPFDRIVFRAPRSLSSAMISIDHVALTAGRPGAEAARAKPRPIQMSVDCGSLGTPISPLIYGIAFDAMHDAQDKHQWQLGATARRWGGNTTSTYNWELDAWNTGNDWFFRNVRVGDPKLPAYRAFLESDAAHRVASALTVPMLGFVAKDTNSVGFPISVLGPQQVSDPYFTEAGNGLDRDGHPLPNDPRRTGTPSGPESVKRWLQAIRAADAKSGHRSVQMYVLDNEPMLWSSGHRDVHPEAVGYDELLEKTLAYAHAIRQADPDAVIAGPALWGWPAYQYSAIDQQAGFGLHPDRRAHGNQPLLAWYLRQLKDHEDKTGERLLDVVDVHFYPQGNGVYGPNGGAVDATTNARRIRSTRALWDPTYVDESWIGEPIQLIPRLRGWIDANYPGRSISIGEYNFGGERHMSGGLAEAEALGRFGQLGVYSAFDWTYPPEGSPAFWALRAYRNFDGQGGHFLETSLPTTASANSSLFASRNSSGGHLVAVALNLDPEQAGAAHVALQGCGLARGRAYSYRGGPRGFTPAGELQGNGAVELQLPPYSITVIDLTLTP